MATEVTFRFPPVVETILSMQFGRLPGLTNGHLGGFWGQRKAEWPSVSDAPLLDETFETFGDEPGWSRAFRLRLTQDPSGRVQMRNKAGDRMIQVQNCRLDYNWIAQPDQAYPRYRTVRPEFDAVLREFRGFVKEHCSGEPIPNQWEVTYVNHMPKGTVWRELEDVGTVFPSLLGCGGRQQGIGFEGFHAQWRFEIVPRRGRLHVAIQHAYVGTQQKKEAIVMMLTARGPVEKEGDELVALDRGLNLGHDLIVTSFVGFTSEEARAYWNREKSNANE